MDGEGPAGWGAPLYARVLELAAVGAGERLLDLGCGRGDLARLAADAGVRVTGIDTDPAAVAVAAAGPGEFRVGDAHDPPPGPFAAVVAVQLLAHVTNPLVVLRRAAAVGERVVVTVWGREEECDVRVFGEALAPWLPPRRPAPRSVTDPARLRKLGALASLDFEVDEVVCPFRYPDADTVLTPLLASGLGQAAVRRAGERAVRDAVLDRLAEFRRGPGYELSNLFRVATATTATSEPR